jgi:hypothetical protein
VPEASTNPGGFPVRDIRLGHLHDGREFEHDLQH